MGRNEIPQICLVMTLADTFNVIRYNYARDKEGYMDAVYKMHSELERLSKHMPDGVSMSIKQMLSLFKPHKNIVEYASDGSSKHISVIQSVRTTCRQIIENRYRTQNILYPTIWKKIGMCRLDDWTISYLAHFEIHSWFFDPNLWIDDFGPPVQYEPILNNGPELLHRLGVQSEFTARFEKEVDDTIVEVFCTPDSGVVGDFDYNILHNIYIQTNDIN